MGEHEGWLQPDGLLPNGLLPIEVSNVIRVLNTERWSKAEERTAELIACIQPNRPSEERRNAVASYVQRLIMKCFSCEVFTFGSVPLKTYLPDGDIDLTVFSKNEDLKDTWANEVREVLENEERSVNAEFHVKEVQYIQAEVKIIKCLVENIVVDISFNQVGGLCTLCFLEEIDHLIGQNHLFKRSIILIKAWCYYESRILGAHHGLISTYALETLVLYIFHVFNNTFAGPLEVLFRFLEFFSNFDWDNYCVSLWGPVPINSLPDMTAEPPRKDGGELLLSKLFLEACSAVYAVFPGGQENQGQQFVTKYFNVIDPLRTNNNLGRSVSKGNFYRIRSAFAFGAKKLVNLLDCSNENLVIEVNQFFMNTWGRHGSGKRPDAPVSSMNYQQMLNNGLTEEPNNYRGLTHENESGNIGLHLAYEHQTDRGHASHGYASHILNNGTQDSQILYGTSNSSTASGQKNSSNQINFQKTNHLDKNARSSVSIQPETNQKNVRSDFLTNLEGQGRFQFARTRSSPELMGTAADVLSQMKHNRVVEAGKKHNEHSMSEYGSRRKYMGSEVSNVGSTGFPMDDPSLRRSSSKHSLEAGTDSISASNSLHGDSGFTAMGEELASVSEALELQQQEEQDFVNMMASSRIHNGQIQLPIHFASSQFPFSVSPVLASMGYTGRNLAGIVPTNITFIEPSWGSSVHFPQGFVASPLPHYFANSALNSNSEEADSLNENSRASDVNPEDGDHVSWHDHDVESTGDFELENGEPRMYHSDGRKHSPPISYNCMPSSQGSFSATSILQGNLKIAKQRTGPSDDYPDAFPNRTSRVSDISATDTNAHLRFFPVTQASSSRSKPASETSRDALNSKVSKPARDKWGRKPNVPAVVTSKENSSWQSESALGSVSSANESDEQQDWVPISTAGMDKAERTYGPANPASMHARNQQSIYEPAQISGTDSVIPIAPMLFGNSQQGLSNNLGFLPFAFYPTGPPVPFLTMLPVYNVLGDNTNPGSINEIDKEDGGEQTDKGSVNEKVDTGDRYSQSDIQQNQLDLNNSNGVALETSEEQKSDILNSDFASHWKNLQYGRLCQNTPNYGPIVYPPPVMVPSVYLHGHAPFDGHSRPPAANGNFFTQIMGYGPRLVPVTSLQAGPSRPSSVFLRYGDELPRYRGTGTYLPNPRSSFRERHFPSSRNHRGSYNYDRGDHTDREGSWINSKARSAARNLGRNPTDKLGLRTDRWVASDSRTERARDWYGNDQVSSLQPQSTSFGSSSASINSTNATFGMYSLPGVSSNSSGPARQSVPPVLMLYPYEEGVSCGSAVEPLEFGSLGPVPLSKNDAPRPGDGNPTRRIHDPRHGAYRVSPRSSPDQPSSPQVPR
ncbi:hypothetical protein HPP92_019984 [Vanilla planifolia]|uniref:Polymerase nucleotidyl transferase domain-containing protein n=1 Tax=Vanilla planifolia TaxID=51239 RepID=A0A835UK30_VANPL|nr:hypothetical protein HPP92_020417 [Vanilla planifolia]KAG0465820.1 hypothetical protein HPP92_019984 [Vanilla planifolia]